MDRYLARGLDIAASLLAEAERAIRELDSDPPARLVAMEEAFRVAWDAPCRRVPWNTLLEDLGRRKVLFVGDFATCPQPRALVAQLLMALPGAQLLLHTPGRVYQPLVDDHLRPQSRLPFSELLALTDLCQRIPDYALPATGRLLAVAARGRVPVWLFEPPVEATLQERDEALLEQLEALLSQNPAGPVVVLVGELRLQPRGLLHQASRRAGPGQVGVLVTDAPRPWLDDLAQGRSGMGRFAVGPGRYVVVGQSPLARMQSFLAPAAWDEIPLFGGSLPVTFDRYARRIADFFELPWPRRTRPRILQPGDPRLLPLARQRGLSPDQVDYLADQMTAGQSRFLPECDLAYIGNTARSHVAEEAAHFVRARTGGPGYAREGEDAFWGIAIHELLGYAGSKVIEPARVPPTLDVDQVAALQLDPEARAHLYGYQLGQRLWERMHQEPDVRSHVAALFLQDLVEAGAAKRLYFRSLDRASARSVTRS